MVGDPHPRYPGGKLPGRECRPVAGHEGLGRSRFPTQEGILVFQIFSQNLQSYEAIVEKEIPLCFEVRKLKAPRSEEGATTMRKPGGRLSRHNKRAKLRAEEDGLNGSEERIPVHGPRHVIENALFISSS
ncbi:hypothetical protein CIHG_05093 [Coccidioides immitis H538.4]|uniref:Uncharacterized protein n=1 Tax=Coccidioides immitis H538.4 TaxID=396776 RepID=A0A0J8UI98_COCIT|nr:hypothetical protein CIHG_05093 [Coccidioides immitis H538.4]